MMGKAIGLAYAKTEDGEEAVSCEACHCGI
jgi:hypothetical protein